MPVSFWGRGLIYSFEDYCLDVDRQELRRGAERVEVEPQVFDLLQYIIRNRERVVSKDDLIAQVWHGRIVSDSTLTSRITAVRQAVGDSGNRQRLIRTIARKGIRFVGEVHDQVAPLAGEEAAAAPPLPDKPSIAVLPFDNMSGDPEQRFFADGIAEDIITALSCYPSLFVIARNSSFSFSGRGVDLKQLGRQLGVRYVLEGSLRKSGSRVRVTAQLIEAESGNHVWAERYDRDIAEIFAVQDEITLATTTAIAPVIAEAERQRALRKPPASLDAWGAHQRGLWHLSQANSKDDALAATFFQRAIDLDPMFAGGYIGLSSVLARAKGTQVKEEEMARRAVALDGSNADAHARLALSLNARGDHRGARAKAEEALALCPNLAEAQGALGVILAYAGQPAEGVAALMTCIRLDPRAPTLVNRLNQLALAHYFCRDYSAAAEVAERAIRAYPDFPSPHRWLAAACGQLGRKAQGKAALQQAMKISAAEFDFQVTKRPPWFRPVDHEHMRAGLRKSGWRG
jgi:adenylate cyclase